MFSDEELLALDQKGYLPGPDEDEESFLKRVAALEKLHEDPQGFFSESLPFPIKDRVYRHHWDLKRSDVKHIFHICPDWLVSFYQNNKLPFWQGAATWIYEDSENDVKLALLQLRKGLKKGKYLGIYELDEIIAHESVHAARMTFDEPVFEEHLAYLTSSSTLRRIFGSLFRKSYEFFLLFLFLMGIFLGMSLDLLGSVSFAYTLFRASYIGMISLFAFGLIRLGYRHIHFLLAYKKIEKLTVFPFPVMLRLRDREIIHFARSSLEEIQKYLLQEKEKSLRWRLINLAYFKGTQ